MGQAHVAVLAQQLERRYGLTVARLGVGQELLTQKVCRVCAGDSWGESPECQRAVCSSNKRCRLRRTFSFFDQCHDRAAQRPGVRDLVAERLLRTLVDRAADVVLVRPRLCPLAVAEPVPQRLPAA